MVDTSDPRGWLVQCLREMSEYALVVADSVETGLLDGAAAVELVTMGRRMRVSSQRVLRAGVRFARAQGVSWEGVRLRANPLFTVAEVRKVFSDIE